MGPAGLTAVFGKGTGVAPPVWSPGSRPAGLCAPPAGDFRWLRPSCTQPPPVGGVFTSSPRVAPSVGTDTLLGASRHSGPAPFMSASGRGGQAARLLGPVRCGGRPPCTPGPSTWSSSRSLQCLHTRKPGLGGGFALRCLQRLSAPDLATRRCPERDSRHTSGRSSPILSY